MFLKSLLFISLVALLVSAALWQGIELGQLFNIESLLIVFGGMAIALRLGFPYQEIKETLTAVKYAMSKQSSDVDPEKILTDILKAARTYRINGPNALGKAVKSIDNQFLRFGATLVADGYDRWALASALEREDSNLKNERKTQIDILRTLARLAPALGMAGTVISLMQVMQDIQNPGGLTSSIGLALSSTLYGILMANLVFIPFTSKLETLARREASERTMLAEALLDMHQAEHPMRIAEKMNCYDLYCRLKKEEVDPGVEQSILLSGGETH